MNDKYSTLFQAIAEAGNDDLHARFCLSVEVWNDERCGGQSRAETLALFERDGGRFARSLASSSAVSQLLRVVGFFRSYDDMIRQIDKAGATRTWDSARRLAYAKPAGSPKAPKAPKAFDAAKRAHQIGDRLSADERRALAAALLAL